MRSFASVCLAATLAWAGSPHAPRGSEGSGLRYRMRLWMKGDPAPVEARFLLTPTPVLVTRNKVQKPRMGGWRLEMDHDPALKVPAALLLARAEGLLYLSGPGPGLTPRSFAVRYGSRKCAVWEVKAPDGLAAHAYLAEISPDLLALSYVSVIPRGGDVASVEIQLESLDLPAKVAPAEDGTALLRTLRALSDAPRGGGAAGEAQMEAVP